MKNKIFRLPMVLALVALLCVTALAAEYTAESPENFYRALATGLKNQETTISITYTGEDLPQGSGLAFYQRYMMATLPLEENAQIYGLNIETGKLTTLGDQYAFHGLEYLNTPEELAWVESRVNQIVTELDLDGLTDLTKTKVIYEYVTRNFIYDDTLTKFTAYEGLQEGTMVCQGYALLVYQMLEEAGLRGQIVLGSSRDQNHAWNGVEIDGLWYALDATWDAADQHFGQTSWDYFVKSSLNFPGHTIYEPFTTEAYLTAYPQGETALELPTIQVTSKGDKVGTLIIRKDVPAQLEVTMPAGYDAEDAIWTSMNPDLFTFDGSLITGAQVGTTWFTVEHQSDRGVIGAQIPTTVVDMSSLSPWAKERVTAYYLESLLPASSCYGFNQGVTREEVARILRQLIGSTVGSGSFSVHNDYTDIDDSYDALAILAMKALGIMEGTSETTFEPLGTLTRQDAASVIVRLMAFVQSDIYEVEATPAYGDWEQVDHWAADNVAIATQLGLLQGDESGNFNPHDRITKEEFITVLARIYETIPMEEAAA